MKIIELLKDVGTVLTFPVYIMIESRKHAKRQEDAREELQREWRMTTEQALHNVGAASVPELAEMFEELASERKELVSLLGEAYELLGDCRDATRSKHMKATITGWRAKAMKVLDVN